MSSQLFILDFNGKLIISRDYRGNIPTSKHKLFVKKVITENDGKLLEPILQIEDYTFIHYKNDNLFFVMICDNNSNAMMLMDFLIRLVKVFEDYFNVVNEEAIKDNFVTVYELLDETIDYGWPQLTESDLLKDFIQIKHSKISEYEKVLYNKGIIATAYKMNDEVNKIGQMTLKEAFHKITDTKVEKQLKVPTAVTNAISWRKEGIYYPENKVFMDVIEYVNMICGSNGKAIHSEVIGRIKVKSELSGMPELKLGLNDKVLFEAMNKDLSKASSVDLEDIKFHQCVQLTRFKEDRTIYFVPPDGEFELLSYRLDEKVKPLILVHCKPNVGSSRIEYDVTVKAQYKNDSSSSEVIIKITVPSDSTNFQFTAQIGSAKYYPEKDEVHWKITNFQGTKSYSMNFSVEFFSITDEQNFKSALKKPISVWFQIPYYTISGLQVRYLKVHFKKLDKQGMPFVRYYTQAEDYQVRI